MESGLLNVGWPGGFRRETCTSHCKAGGEIEAAEDSICCRVEALNEVAANAGRVTLGCSIEPGAVKVTAHCTRVAFWKGGRASVAVLSAGEESKLGYKSLKLSPLGTLVPWIGPDRAERQLVKCGAPGDPLPCCLYLRQTSGLFVYLRRLPMTAQK